MKHEDQCAHHSSRAAADVRRPVPSQPGRESGHNTASPVMSRLPGSTEELKDEQVTGEHRGAEG